jgi:glycosyltransferase involved in cell wall biosynthesis
MHTTYYFFTPGFHQRVMQHARFLTALTETMRQQAKVVVSDIQRIVVLPNAIDLQPYDLSLTGSHIRRDFDIPLDAQVIVLAGRFSTYKGQEELIHASALFMHKYVHTYILLAGNEDDVEFTAHIQSLIDQYNLGNRIKMIGYRSDIPEVMACANIVVMPSRDEPFGLVALEGMAMGKPVVATRVGGIPSFIKDGETGLLIDPCDPQALAEAISLLLDNPDIAKTIGERARAEVIEHYHADIYGQRFVSFMRDALQQL